MNNYKKVAKELRKKYKGFKFECDENILIIDVKLPFRIMESDASGLRHCNDKEYQKIQNDLRRELAKIDNTETITVVECGYLQYFTKNLDTIFDVVDHIREFIKVCTEKYGKYIKMGKDCNKELLKDLGIETVQVAKFERKKKRNVKAVLQYSLNGEFIKEWDNAYEAAEAVSGVYGAAGNIYQCCLNHYKTAYGYVWKYKL